MNSGKKIRANPIRIITAVIGLLMAAVSVCVQCRNQAPVSNIPPAPPGKPARPAWTPVPLRTARQKAAGLTGGEMGQQAFSIAVHPKHPEYMALAIDTAAVYLSTDGARSWRLKRNGILCNGVQSIAFDPGNHNILWAAGLNGINANPDVEGIYRTVDGGSTWQRIYGAGYRTQQAQNEYFAFDPASFSGTRHTTVYAATHDQGLLKTTDDGKTWRSLGFRSELINAVIVHPLNGRLVFLASETGLYRSDDAGRSLRKTGGDSLGGAPVAGLALNPKDDSVLYVTTGAGGIWRSRDGGRRFTKIMKGIPAWAVSEKWPWLRVAVSPADPRRLYADARWGGLFPYWSHDGGDTWHPPRSREPTILDVGSTDPYHWFTEGLTAHPTDPDIAYCATPFMKTADGGRTWRYASEGISGFRRNTRTSIAFRPGRPREMVLFHGDFGCARTKDGGDTFDNPLPPRQDELGSFNMPVGAYEPVPGSSKIISAIGGGATEKDMQRICVSLDDCRTWKVLRGTEGDYCFLAFHPQHPQVVYLGRRQDSMRSLDGGATWHRVPHPIKAMFQGNGDIVYAARQSVKEREWEVLRSDDRGETWRVLPGRIGTWDDVRELDVDPADPDRLYAASNFGLWVFDGRGWTVRNERHGLNKSRFGNVNVWCVAVDPTSPNVVYAGQNECWNGLAAGVFRSTDYGKTWRNINYNLGPDLTVWAVTVSPLDGTVWLATDYGNWKLPSPPAGP